jgi:hypothetical protein
MSSYDPYYPALPPADPVTLAAAARERVQFPAIFLLIVGAINLMAALPPVFIGVAMQAVPPDQLERRAEEAQPADWKMLKDKGFTIKTVLDIYFYGGVMGGAVIGLLGVVAILGGARMLVLRSFGLAVFAAITAAIPCLSPSGCCLLGQLVGVWALVVLLDPDVRAAFT